MLMSAVRYLVAFLCMTFLAGQITATGAENTQSRNQTNAGVSAKAPEIPAVGRWPTESDFPGRGPVQTNEWFRERWCQFRHEWYLNRDKEKKSVVFFGDSITEGLPDLEQSFPGMKTANRGISGDTSRGLRCRLQDVLDLDPLAVVILIGTNDLGMDAEPGQVMENIKALVDALKRSNTSMPVVVCHVMPRAVYPGYFPERLMELNNLIDTSFKNDKQVRICDTWSIFATEEGGIRRSEFPDLLHPNAAGYEKWAAALKPILTELKLLKK